MLKTNRSLLKLSTPVSEVDLLKFLTLSQINKYKSDNVNLNAPVLAANVFKFSFLLAERVEIKKSKKCWRTRFISIGFLCKAFLLH